MSGRLVRKEKYLGMKSNVYVLKGCEDDIKFISNEIEKVSDYNHLERKKVVQLLLLSEELIGIQKGILGFTKGEFYIENDGNEYRLCLHSDIFTDVLTQERFVEISNKNENIAVKGIKGKIRYVVNYLMNANVDMMPEFDLFNSQSSYHCYATPTTYDKVWSLEGYKDGIAEGTEVWDEMERSIVAKLADDVIVGATAKYIDLIVVKRFD